MIVGSDKYVYEVVEPWPRLPRDWTLGDVAGVAVDSLDRVFVFNRGPHPMMVFDRDGHFLSSWGEGRFERPHAVHMGPDDTIYCTDDGRGAVLRCTLDGEVLLEILGEDHKAPFMSGRPFNRCTHTALSPAGEIYVSDGYGNARIQKFSPDGELLLSWGEPGVMPGQFNLPHNMTCDPDGWVYVADRENHRIQVFDGAGHVEAVWNNLVHRPSALFMTSDPDPMFYVGEIGPYYDYSLGAPNLGPRITLLTGRGELVARLARSPSGGTGPGQFVSPHGICVDSLGDVYLGDVAVTAWPRLFPGVAAPPKLRSLQKLAKVHIAGS